MSLHFSAGTPGRVEVFLDHPRWMRIWSKETYLTCWIEAGGPTVVRLLFGGFVAIRDVDRSRASAPEHLIQVVS
jgi:hypothetical protein